MAKKGPKKEYKKSPEHIEKKAAALRNHWQTPEERDKRIRSRYANAE